MRNTFKVLFYANKGKEKNGFVPILGRVTVNGQVSQFSCKLSVSRSLWDAKGNRAKGKSEEAQRINRALDKIKARIIELYNQIRERENFVSAEMVRNAYQGVGNEYECLLTAFDKYTADFGKRVGKDRAFSTYNKLCVVRRHLADFIRSYYKRRDIAMKELTEEFIRQFDIYLRTTVGLASSTIWMYIIPLKAIVTHAHCNGHLHRNPFAQYHISPNVKERQFLTEEELQRVMTIRLDSPQLGMVRDIFVFCCLTGISYIDTKNLTADNLENINGGWWIVSKRQKTGVPFRVKLLDSAYRIIERYEPIRKGNHLFRLYGNTYANRMLKRITKACGIEKPISWHCSRHSFATLALGKGMPIESVSRILGHTNITTTQIYAKITTEKLDRDISAFGEKLEAGLVAKISMQPGTPTIIRIPTRTRHSRKEAVN